MRSLISPVSTESALYRRAWRWHFYAGLVCLPFLTMMALTGALYLYKEPIESLIYARQSFRGYYLARGIASGAAMAEAYPLILWNPDIGAIAACGIGWLIAVAGTLAVLAKGGRP